ncbi:MAG: tRNA (adenosine(37)-N6)-threonylcarbamoyltransferase complex ATPase subunit type 1 TsaE [Candidatus Bipolaricaulota bacterium]
MERTVVAEGPEETQRVGEELAHRLKSGDVVALVGELGAGKTTLVQGLARGLFIKEDVLSPSFVLARTHQGRLTLHHMDAYRINDPAELAEVGLTELLPPEEGVTALEWADRIPQLIPRGAIWVTMTMPSLERRRIEIRGGPS